MNADRRGELMSLKVGQFDRIARIVRLKGLDTKSGKPRELGVSDELYALLMVCSEGKGPNDHVFTARDGAWLDAPDWRLPQTMAHGTHEGRHRAACALA